MDTPSTVGLYQNDIPELPGLNRFRYEKIFRVYETKGAHYFYSLIKKISIPTDIDETKIYYMTVRSNLPWTMISFKAYQTIELWWLICLVNKIDNPLIYPETGTNIKILRPEYLPTIYAEIDKILI
jgi:hypothetical protein